MDCSPEGLIDLVRCTDGCVPPGVMGSVEIAAACAWANAAVTPPCPLPNKAITPNPVNGATLVLPYAPVLSWVNGGGATSYNVWFNGVFIGNQAGLTYAPGILAFNTAFTWRIDAVNACGTTTGDTWTFTTVGAFSYAPATAIITWTDVHGAGQTGNLAFFNATADMGSVIVVDIHLQGITSLSNLATLPALAVLQCYQNNFPILSITNNPALNYLAASYSGIFTVDLSGAPALDYLNIAGNPLTVLDTSNNPLLNFLQFNAIAGLTSVDISNNSLLMTLNAANCALTILAVNTILSKLVTFGLTGGAMTTAGQTPVAPPSVGPPNGIAAKAALLAELPPWAVATD